jgi:hypothetical protein
MTTPPPTGTRGTAEPGVGAGGRPAPPTHSAHASRVLGTRGTVPA